MGKCHYQEWNSSCPEALQHLFTLLFAFFLNKTCSSYWVILPCMTDWSSSSPGKSKLLVLCSSNGFYDTWQTALWPTDKPVLALMRYHDLCSEEDIAEHTMGKEERPLRNFRGVHRGSQSTTLRLFITASSKILLILQSFQKILHDNRHSIDFTLILGS